MTSLPADERGAGDDVISDGGSHTHFSSTLRVFGDGLDLDWMTREMGLAPTTSHHAGDRRGLKSPPYRQAMWCYTAPVPRSEPLRVHLDTLWSAIRHRRDFLLSLKPRYEVDIFSGYISDRGWAGFEVPAASLEMFTALEVPFGLSIIVSI